MLYILGNMDDNDFIVIMFKRDQRNQLLKESDKYLLPDYPITSNNLILIKQYRQELRDYMDSTYFSSNIILPFPDFPQFPF